MDVHQGTIDNYLNFMMDDTVDKCNLKIFIQIKITLNNQKSICSLIDFNEKPPAAKL